MPPILFPRRRRTTAPYTMTRLRGWPALALDQLEDRTTPTVNNLIPDGSVLQLDNGGVFIHTSESGGAGSDKFLDIANPGIEQGYNTDAKPLDLDTKEPTRAILLGDVPTVTVNGTTYYELNLDVNQSSGSPGIVLNDLRLYTAPFDNLNGYNTAARTLGGRQPVYDMDYVGAYPGTLQNHDLLLYYDGGSGTAELRTLFPASLFQGLDPATTYLYVYSRFGDVSGLTQADVPVGTTPDQFQADQNPEHWSFATGLPSLPLADLRITKSDEFNDNPLTLISPGLSNHYTITITNAGPTPVTAVRFVDVVPDPAQYTVTIPAGQTHPFVLPAGVTFTGAYDPGTHTYSGVLSGFTLAVGGSLTLTLSGTLSPTATAPVVNEARVYTTGFIGELPTTLDDNVAIDTDPLGPQADLQVTKTDGITTVVAGQTVVTYTIVVSNPVGPSNVVGARVTDTFPADLTNVSWTSVAAGGADGNTAGPATGPINDLVNLPVGGSITYTVTATVGAAATVSITNTAAVAPPTGTTDPVSGNNSATDTDTVGLAADLRITKSNNTSTATPGMPLSYTIVVSNPVGPSNVVGAVVTDTFPPELINVSWTSVAAGGASDNQPSGSGNISDVVNVPVGGTITYTVTGTVSPTLVPSIPPAPTTTISNTAAVAAPAGVTDPNPANNSATHSDDVLPAPVDLSAEKTAPASVVPGTTATYTVTFRNTNALQIPVVGAAVTDTFTNLPGLFVAGTVTWQVTATSLGASAASGGALGTGNLVDTVTLPAGGFVTYTVAGQVRPDAVLTGQTQIVNTAAITPPAGVADTNGANNQVTRTVPLAAPQVDLTIAKTDVPAVSTSVPGTAITYTITVTNLGPSAVNAVTLTDNPTFLLPGFTFSPSQGSYTPGTGAWTGLSLAPGTSVTMSLSGTINPAATGSITNTATVAAPAGVSEPNTANNTASDTNALTPQADLSVTKTDSQTTAVPGDPLTYTIVVSNAGPSAVTGATVADTFPAGLTNVTWTSVAAGGASDNQPSGSGNISDVVNVPVGGTITYTVTATVSSAATGTLSNTVTVTEPAGVTDPTQGNNSATDDDTLTPSADLQVTKTDGQSTATPGQSVTYTIKVTNAGPSDATGVTVSDPIPAALTGVTWTATATGGAGGFTASGSGNLISDPVTMPAGSTITYTVTGTVNPAATGTLVNTATVLTPAGLDPAPGNNTATDSDALAPSADLAVTKTDGVTSVGPGDPVTYTIVVSNAGPSAVTGATVADTFPPELTGVTWTAAVAGGAAVAVPSGSGPIAGTVNLPVGGTVTYTVTGTVALTATSGFLVNTATVTPPADVADPTTGNNSATDTDQIGPRSGLPTDLQVTKGNGLTEVVPGTTVTYTIVVTNAGPNPATGASAAVVTDNFPAELTGVTWTASGTNGAVPPASGSGPINATIDMPVNSTVTFVVTGTVAAGARGFLTNTAAVSSQAPDPVPGNNTATDSDPLTPRADLQVTKGNGLTALVPGQTVTYTVVVSNAGPSAVTGARVTDTFPAGLTNVSWTSVAAGGASPSTVAAVAGPINQLVDLPVGGTITYTVTATVDPNAAVPPLSLSSISNTAAVEVPAGVTETDPSDNSATDTDPLTPRADLQITKVDVPASPTAVPGTTITYQIVVTNVGPGAVSGATVSDLFPAALSNVTWSGTAGGGASAAVGSGTGNLSDTLTLPVGGTVTYTVTADIDPAATGRLVNTAAVAPPAGVTDPTPGNNTATDDDALVPTGNLTVTKGNGVNSVVAGQAAPVTYTITIGNTGPSTLTSLLFNDTSSASLANPTFTFPAGSLFNPVTGELSGIVLPPNGTITVFVTGTVPASATGNLVNTVTVTPPAGAAATDADSDPIDVVADLGVTKDDLTDFTTPGASLTYTVVVTNAGPSDVVGATVADAFPAELLNVSWTATATGGATGFTAAAGPGAAGIADTVSMPVGSTITYTVTGTVDPTITPVTTPTIANTVTVAVPAGVTDPGRLPNTATHVDDLFPAQVDLSAAKTAPAAAVPGQTATYTVTFTNSNALGIPVVAAPVTDLFADVGLFAAGTVTWQVTASSAGASAGIGAGVGTGNLVDTVTLPAGGFVTYTVTGTVRPDARVTLHNDATIQPPAGVVDTNGTNNRAPADVRLTPFVDLAVAKTDTPAAITSVPGTAITYTITVTNLGPSALNETDGPVTLTDTPQFLLPGFTFAESAGVYDLVTGLWTGLNLAPGASATLTLTGTIDPTATGTLPGNLMTNRADVTAPGTVTDPVTVNNTASDENRLTPQADVSIVKTNPAGTPNFGQEIPGLPVTYTITVSNAGPSVATGVVVADTFPAVLSNATWTSVATGGATGNDPTGTGNIADVVDLPVGATVVYTVTALIDPAATGTLANTATATVPQGITDPTSVNGVNTSTHPDQLAPQADLAVTKSSSVTTATVGDALVYTVTVTNLGPSTVTGFTLTETLPPQYQVTGQTPSAGAYDPATGAWTGLTLATGQSVTLTITGTVTAGAGGNIDNVAVVAPPAGVNDYNASNNLFALSLPVVPARQVVAGPAAPLPLIPLPPPSKRDLLASSMATTDPLTGPYRAALADFNGDGVRDTVVASPAGVPGLVQVLDGRTGQTLFSVAPFEPTFTGGLFVTAGDLTGDGVPDLVVSPDQGGGPRVQVYSGAGFARVLDFFGIDDPNFRGGVRLAVGDVNADGAPDLAVAAGYGGGPRITVWDGQSLRAGAPAPMANFLAFEPALRNGAYVAAGDLDGDGFADLIFGGGPGGGPRVLVVSGQQLTAAGPAAAFAAPLANFFAGPVESRAGVRVAFWDTDGDTRGELVVGSGPGETPARLWAYDAPAVVTPAGAAPQDLTGLMSDFLLSGVFVG